MMLMVSVFWLLWMVMMIYPFLCVCVCAWDVFFFLVFGEGGGGRGWVAE